MSHQHAPTYGVPFFYVCFFQTWLAGVFTKHTEVHFVRDLLVQPGQVDAELT